MIGGALFSDDELAALALAADPDAVIPADALPLWRVLEPTADPTAAAALPSWYMPRPDPRAPEQLLKGWRKMCVYALIIAFVGIHAYGLCNTYGNLRIR